MKKAEERLLLDAFVGLRPDLQIAELRECESPDFLCTVGGIAAGIELTRFFFPPTGRVSPQAVYKYRDQLSQKKTHDEEKDIATLLVMVRFVQLIRSTLNVGPLQCPVPLLATAHDFDMFGRFLPQNVG